MKETKLCPGCNGYPGGLKKIRLADGTMVCSDCAKKIDEHFLESAKKQWSEKEFREYMFQRPYANLRRPQFSCSDQYHSLRFDEENGLLAVVQNRFTPKKNKLKPEDFFIDGMQIEGAEIEYAAKTAKKGMLGSSANGDVYLVLKLCFPKSVLRLRIASNAKFRGEFKGIINKRFEYDYPEELVVIMNKINAMIADDSGEAKERMFFAAKLYGFDTGIPDIQAIINRREELLKEKPENEKQINFAFAAMLYGMRKYWEDINGILEIDHETELEEERICKSCEDKKAESQSDLNNEESVRSLIKNAMPVVMNVFDKHPFGMDEKNDFVKTVFEKVVSRCQDMGDWSEFDVYALAISECEANRMERMLKTQCTNGLYA